MIKISKPTDPPAILATRGVPKRDEYCGDYDASPADYDSGKRRFSFDAAIYSDVTVKEALIAAQHGKCCFCETIIREESDVEHFRPKAGCRQGRRMRLERPGYYWLAYDWDNLLLACPICNQRHKMSYFPLADAAQRVRNHRADVSQEQSLFINPAEVDPSGHIAFRKEVAFPVGNRPSGRVTINELGLNRSLLIEKRLKHLDTLNTYQSILNLEVRIAGDAEGRRLVAKARAALANAIGDDAEFTAMTTAAAATGFRRTLL